MRPAKRHTNQVADRDWGFVMEMTPEQLEQMKTEVYQIGYREGEKFAAKFIYNRLRTILENELKQWGTGTMAYTLIMRCILLVDEDQQQNTKQEENK
jgi:hypothetical protein